MDNEQGQTIEHANYNPVDLFRNRVREWWQKVLETEKAQTPIGSALAAEKNQLLERAMKIRKFIEKLPGMGTFFQTQNLDGIMLPIVGIAAATAASVIGAIKLWEQSNQAFNHKMTVYTDARAMGYSAEQSAQLAIGIENRQNMLPKWLIYAPWLVLGVGAVYWFWFRKPANYVERD